MNVICTQKAGICGKCLTDMTSQWFLNLLTHTLSRELPLSLFFSGRLFPESVLMSEPRESAWRTELMLGVDDV